MHTIENPCSAMIAENGEGVNAPDTKPSAGGEPRLIHTVRGVGYALREA